MYPEGFDWEPWVARWDRMQERYLVAREERFSLIVALIAGTQGRPAKVLDLGCGTGSLAARLLEHFPDTHVYGIDMDPTLLPLAEERLKGFGGRFHAIERDLRQDDWTGGICADMDAVVSATALHWLDESLLVRLYGHFGGIMRPGAIFLNADHVGSECEPIQRTWVSLREAARREEATSGGEQWSEFWTAYLEALGSEARAQRDLALGQWTGVEDGLPLWWHLDQLRAAGFRAVDCFWRHACDAIYGGVR